MNMVELSSNEACMLKCRVDQGVGSGTMTEDEVLFQIRNRFANPDHSAVPLSGSPANEEGMRAMMVR